MGVYLFFLLSAIKLHFFLGVFLHFITGADKYNPKRFASDVYLYEFMVDFLSDFGPVSAKNHHFLQRVYSYALLDTINVISNSSLAPVDKLREYRAIAEHPLTQTMYRECKDNEEILQSKKELFFSILRAGSSLKGQDDQNLRNGAQCLAPRCGQAVFAANAKLFLEDPKLLNALLQDDLETLMRELLTRIEKNQFVKKYPIPETIQALAVDNVLLCQITDAVFLRRFSKIYLQVWQGETLAALEEMTGMLLENRVSGGQEAFLQLYISLSAVLEQVPAFVYGKLKLAQLYFQQKRLPECRAVVADLEEMNLTDSEELNALRRDLETAGL